MDALICNVCGDTAVLDGRDVVAAAEIALFVEAHCGHDWVSIDFCDVRERQSQGSQWAHSPPQD